MKNLENMKYDDIRALAKELQIKGWWKMKKDELIRAIEEATPEAPEEVKEVANVNTSEEKENATKTNLDDQEKPKKKNHKRLIEYKGEVKTLTAWAKELGIRHQTLYNRIVMKGMDPIEAFEMPTKKPKEVTVND